MATAEDVVDAILHLAYALVCALIITRQAGNLFGWAFFLVAVFFPEEPTGLSGEAGQIALAVVGILAFPVAVGIAIFRPATETLPQAGPRSP